MTFPSYERKGFKCQELSAFDAVSLLPEVYEVFPGESIAFLSEEARKAIYTDPKAFEVIGSTTKLGDEVFVNKIFKLSKLEKDGKRFTSEDIKDAYELFELLSWICECTYFDGLNRKTVVLPEELQNAGEALKKKRKKEKDLKDKSTGYNVTSRKLPDPPPPINIPPWIFSVVAYVDEKKRIDWQLYLRLKKDIRFIEFCDIWEMCESYRGIEARQLLEAVL